MVMWALDTVRSDMAADAVLFRVVTSLAYQNGRSSNPKLPSPYASADDANAKALRRIFDKHHAMETQACTSYTLEPLVMLVCRRMWRNVLAALWGPITRVGIVRLVPDKPRDLLLWRWGNDRGINQSRLFGTPQSWAHLLAESRCDESNSLPRIIKEEFDFSVLFCLCYPHRLTRSLVKHFEQATRWL